MSKPHSHLPFGEEGQGFYSENTRGCFQVIDSAEPLVWQAVQQVLAGLNSASYLSVADFGACDGGTSSVLWRNIFEKIREQQSTLPIWLHYEDQATNDWKSVFALAHQLSQSLQGSDSTIVALKRYFDNVFITGCGTSFFERCYPPRSIHFGFSATAMHWLSDPPTTGFSDALHCSASKDATARALYQEQAAKDWEQILICRASELTDGGEMVLINLATDNDGQFLGSTSNTKIQIFEQFFQIWSAMNDEGRITEGELKATRFANYYRSEAEIRKPFEDESGSVRQARLQLVSVEMKVVPCFYKAYREANPDKMDARSFAEWYVPTLRTWSNYTFLSALSSDRSSSERDDLVDELFKRYTDTVAASPEEHGMDYVHSHVRIKKTKQ